MRVRREGVGVIVPCPQCMNPFQLEDPSASDAGTLIRCPSCSYAFVVKAAGEPEADSQGEADAGAQPAESGDDLLPAPKTEARPPGASIDPAALRRLAATSEGDGSKLVARVVKTYLGSSHELLSAIRGAVEADDVKAFISAANTFKSSSAHMGARRLSSLCEELESLGRGASCQGARELTNRIFEEYESVREELAGQSFEGRAPTDGTSPKSAASSPRPQATTGAEGEGEVLAHVLLAEDNEVNRHVAVAVLESMGCRVDAVEDGQEAIDQLERSSSYDLVLMDCEMPTMDGLAATTAIREREAEAAQAAGSAPARRIPIVALTGHALASDQQDCLAAGMDDHLTKPFTKAQLRGAINRAKQAALAWGQAPAASARPDPPAATPSPPKRSNSPGARPAAPSTPASRSSAENPPGRAAGASSTPRKTPRGPDGLPVAHPGRPPAAPLPAPTASAAPSRRAAPEQKRVASRDASPGKRSRARPRQRLPIHVPRAVMPWAIGGGVFLLLSLLVNLLWLDPSEPEPRLATPSPGTAAAGPVPATWPEEPSPVAVADGGTSAAAPAPPLEERDVTIATPPALTASLLPDAAPAPEPEVVPEPAVSPQPAAKPQPPAKAAPAAKPRKATTPRTTASRAAKPTTAARTTPTPTKRSATPPSSSGRTKAVSAQTRPRTKSGGRRVEKEPKTRSRSSQKEETNGWTIEH